jgi:hypothetical protein
VLISSSSFLEAVISEARKPESRSYIISPHKRENLSPSKKASDRSVHPKCRVIQAEVTCSRDVCKRGFVEEAQKR